VIFTTPEEDNSGIDVFDVGSIARERDRLFRKVYYHAHLVDDFALPFIIPRVGLHGALTRQRDDGRLTSLRVGDNARCIGRDPPRLIAGGSTTRSQGRPGFFIDRYSAPRPTAAPFFFESEAAGLMFV
jgi:hypothetical protein